MLGRCSSNWYAVRWSQDRRDIVGGGGRSNMVFLISCGTASNTQQLRRPPRRAMAEPLLVLVLVLVWLLGRHG